MIKVLMLKHHTKYCRCQKKINRQQMRMTRMTATISPNLLPEHYPNLRTCPVYG
jgi:hypothetical protein